jgi:hypothetical protein
MDTLPTEIKNDILDYLNDRELALTREINQDFKSIAEDERRWRDRTYRKFGKVPQICDSWRLTYRDINEVRPDKAVVVIYFRYDTIFNIKVYLDSTNKPRMFENIVDDIFDELVSIAGPIVIDEEFSNNYHLERHGRNLNLYDLDVDNPYHIQTIEEYLKEFREFVAEKVKNNGEIRTLEYSVLISAQIPEYFRNN